MSSAEGVVLLIGCGRRLYREYLLASAATRHPLWLFNDEQITWQREYVLGGTVVALRNREAVLAAARELAATRPVLGVLTWDEMLVVNTAYVADELGVPGSGIDGAEGCRDKVRNRRMLAGAGLAQPQFDFATDEEQAIAAAERIGYPVIVKPRGLGASISVVLAADAHTVREGFRSAAAITRLATPAYESGALIEEYVTGPEFCIDAAVVDGEYLPLFTARKTLGLYPYFEEFGHIHNPEDEVLSDRRILDTLIRAHRAIGFQCGITCAEIKLTERGPVIIEINGRIAGDMVPLMARFATGIEPGAVAVELALGLHPEIPDPAGAPCVGIRFAYPEQDCVVESIALPERRPDNGLVEAVALVEPGTKLELPPAEFISRYAYVICAGRDPQECAVRLDKALSEVRLTARAPVPSASAVAAG
jgi:biotin carboxylase